MIVNVFQLVTIPLVDDVCDWFAAGAGRPRGQARPSYSAFRAGTRQPRVPRRPAPRPRTHPNGHTPPQNPFSPGWIKLPLGVRRPLRPVVDIPSGVRADGRDAGGARAGRGAPSRRADGAGTRVRLARDGTQAPGGFDGEGAHGAWATRRRSSGASVRGAYCARERTRDPSPLHPSPPPSKNAGPPL